jgi:hypothetical protein
MLGNNVKHVHVQIFSPICVLKTSGVSETLDAVLHGRRHAEERHIQMSYVNNVTFLLVFGYDPAFYCSSFSS